MEPGETAGQALWTLANSNGWLCHRRLCIFDSSYGSNTAKEKYEGRYCCADWPFLGQQMLRKVVALIFEKSLMDISFAV